MKKTFHVIVGILSISMLFLITALAALVILPYFEKTSLLDLFTETERKIPVGQKTPDAIDIDNEQSQKKVSRLSFDEYLEKANLLLKNNYHTLALEEYTKAIRTSPDRPEPYVRIAELYLKKHNYEEAKQNFQKALERSKTTNAASISVGIAKSLIGEKNFTEAKKIVDTILQNDQEVLYYQALLAAFFENYETSTQKFKEISERNLKNDIEKKTQNFLDAFEEFDKYQGGSKNHLKTLLAKSYNESKEYSLAGAILYQVLKESPQYRDAWLLLGYSFLKQENFIDAKNAFEEALKLDSEKAETNYFLGLAYFGIDNVEKAIFHLEIALKNQFKPQIQVKQKLAEMYLLNEEYENAIKYYKEIVGNQEVTPDNYIRPIWIYIEHLKQPKKALELAQDLQKRYPDNAMAYNLLGWSQLANNQLADARMNLEHALQLDPNLDAAYLNFGMLYEKEGNYELAKENYKKAYNLGTGNTIANTAAMKYNQLIEKK